MARITSSVGLISGIDTGSLINALISLDQAPVNLLQTRITKAQGEQQAYTQLGTQLGNIKTAAGSLNNTQTFQATTATSSNPQVLTATTSPGSAVGSFQFQVAQLVSSQQSVSGGFADPNNTKVGAGTMTFDLGGGKISSTINLDQLNGGAGVNRGQFRITDRSGASAVIDTTTDITLDDVVRQINSATDISVHASIVGDALQLTDESGGSAHSFTVKDLGDTTAASDLGIAGTAAAGSPDQLTGTTINYLSAQTPLAQLNDGRGVRSGSPGGGGDFTIVAGDGSSFNVALTTAMTTVGDVLTAINTATGGKVTASIAAGASGITLTDTSGGGQLSVATANNPWTAADLGIATAGSAGSFTGQTVVSPIDTIMLSSLNGGQGLALGSISITDRSGNTSSIPLAGAATFQDILDDINNPANGLGIKASLNAAGDGIQITDTTGGSRALIISDVDSTTAAQLGIAGSFSTTVPSVQGANLHRQYITTNTQLSSMNGGKGVTLGAFNITAADGQTTEVDLSSGNFTNLGQVITSINARGIGVTASINANGNGLLLTDTTAGTGKLTVTDVNSTTAKDLNIAGTATAATLDGAYEKTVQITANDTLSTVVQKINAAGAGVTAAIMNDGSGATPYRLSLNSNNPGLDGQVTIDAGTTGLQMRNLVQAQDAAVFVGGGSGSQPLLITSSNNQLSNVIQGVTITLTGVSKDPVSLSIARDDSGVITQINNFVTAFNSITSQLSTLTSFNTTTNTPGLLLGDSTAQIIQEDLYNMVSGVVKAGGQYKVLADIGLTLDGNSNLTFDQNTFDSAYATDPQSVQNLVTQTTGGIANVMETQVNNLTDPTSGIITLQNQTLTSETQQYQDQINFLNGMIDDKRNRLEEQFTHMEQTLATLQSQQQALGSLVSSGAAKAASNSSSSSSSSSSSGSGVKAG